MATTILSYFILAVLLILFAWLTSRAWKIKNLAVRIGGVLLAGLLTVLLVVITVTALRGFYLSTARRSFPVANVQIQGTPEEMERGEELAIFLCAACHNPEGELPLMGGNNLSADSGLPLGDIYPPNLTPAGELKDWTDGEILRAIREGTHQNGRPLAMPVARLKNLSDEDALAIIAYLRSQPPVQYEVPPLRLTLLSHIMVGAGLYNISAEPVASVQSPPLAPTREYGEYLVAISDCRECHGEDLSGGSPPAPPGPNLRAVTGWTKDQFFTAMRTGVGPGGDPIQPPMIWKNVGSLDDTQLEALYLYLNTIEPVD